MRVLSKKFLFLAAVFSSCPCPTLATLTNKLNAAGAFSDTTVGCIETTVNVAGLREQIGNDPLRELVETFILRRDTCNGIDLIRASETQTAGQQIETEARALSRFSVRGSLQVFDFVSQQFYDVQVDVEWKGQGPVTTTINPGQTSKLRDARVQGTFVLNGENLFATSDLVGSIEMVQTIVT
jgi:hypothetical protein